ncbi:MAG: prephenate dehydrogenase, partial [Bacillota bacterium]
MNIGIIGLGLIGGSMLKAIKKNTSNKCFAYNRTKAVLQKAKPYLDDELTENNMNDMDLIIVSLNPRLTVEYVKKNIKNIKKGCVVIDVCGVKRYIANELDVLLMEKDIHLAPCHPMAGKEVGGFDNSSANLFKGASFIITPTKITDIQTVKVVEDLALKIGFSKIVKATPEEHDRIIAYTSQLAHVVSNAYAKSPNIKKHQGFSAGSFQDLTRVARLDSNMWTELFSLNKDNILSELELVIKNLVKYKKALEEDDY